jgi:type I restriction enzyme S subunit
VVGGGTPSTRIPAYWEGPIPWFTPAEIAEDGAGIVSTSLRTISEQGLRQSAANLLPAGTVLVTSRASIGHCAIAGRPVATNQGFTSLIPDDRRSTQFLYYWVQQKQPTLVSKAAGSTFLEISASKVADIDIATPSLDEQARIGSILGDADEHIAALERMIVKKEAIKQGMMQQLLTGKTRLPGFTEPWREVRLGDHVTYVRSVPLSRAQLDDSSPVRCLHYGDIHTHPDVFLPAADSVMPRASALLSRSAGRLQVGDVVFADASEDVDGVGKSVEIASIPADGVVAGLHTIAARFDKDVLTDGFKAYLQFVPTFRAKLVSVASGTKVLATTRSYISGVDVPLPGTDEQRAIARVLTDADDELDALRARLAKARAVKQGMMQQLLTGRVRLPVREDAA